MSFSENITIDSILGVFYGRYSVMASNANGDSLRLLQWYNSPTWFLPALFMGYVLFKIIIDRNRVYHQVILLIAYLVTSYALNRLPVLLPWSLDTAFIFAIYIYIGMLIKKFSITYLPKISTVSVLFYVICLILNGIVNLSVRYYGHSILLSIIGGIMGSIFIIKSCEIFCKRIPSSIWTIFNRSALVLFCIQMPFLRIGENLCNRVFLIYDNHTWWGGVEISVLQLLTTLTLGYPCAKIISVILHKTKII